VTRVVPLFAVLVPLLALAGPPSDTASREAAARITLKTHGTLRDVAEKIASEGKLSVVVRGDLDEDAEVFFQNVPADEALETLARAYGLSLERHGNIYTLRPHAEGSPPPKMVAPIPPVPPMPPMPPMPSMPRMGHHPGHPSSSDDEDQDEDEDSDQEDQDADEAQNATPPSDFADKFRNFKDLKDLRDLKDLKDLKDVLKFHKRSEGSDRQTVGTGNVTVEEDQEVDDAVAYGGSLLIKGRVRNDAVAFGGNVQLGPHAVVGGDAVAFGGNVEREPGAKVRGQTLSFGGKSGGLSAVGASEKKTRSDRHSGSGIFWLLIQFAIYFALGFVFIMFAPRPMKQLESEIRRDPLRCALTGLLGALAIAGLAVLLTITVIGIPFTLVLIVVTAVGIAMGYSAVASEVGTRLPVLRANRKTQAAVLALGILVLLVLQLIPVLGKLVLAAVTFVALGATIRTRFGTRPREFPEPV
jgi:hypothetical protein